jgi:hypothetical protein
MTDYIQPELMILIPVLYLIGVGLKTANFFPDRFIPILLGLIGIGLTFCHFGYEDIAVNGESFFTAVTQGILCAGASTYANQIYKQIKKDD